MLVYTFVYYFISLISILIVVLQPILANPMDRAAVAKEESSSLFVLQLPTDLRYQTTLQIC